MNLKLHKEYTFLIDVNLPKRFKFFESENFHHVVDINPQMSDEEIWNYALENNLVILTKDTDFYNKFMNAEIIYMQLGNKTLKELHYFFNSNWTDIVEHLSNSNLIIVRENSITAVN